MNELLALFVGVGLAAACGFRVFVPLFIASLAANSSVELLGDTDFQSMLSPGYEWLGSPTVTLVLGIATALEVFSYYIPWLDNVLDSVASPAAVIAGAFLAGVLMPEMMGDGFFKWAVATIAGGGSAGLVQATTVIMRGTATATTGGIGNPVVSTAELGGSVFASILAILVPVAAAILMLVLFIFGISRIVRFLREDKDPKGPDEKSNFSTKGAE